MENIILQDTTENKNRIERAIYLHFFYNNVKLLADNPDLLPSDIIDIRYSLELIDKELFIVGVRINNIFMTLTKLELIADVFLDSIEVLK